MTDRLVLAISELVEALREAARAEAAAVPRAPDRLLSIDQAAGALSLGRSLIYGEIAAGRLASLKVGRRRLIPAEAIANYIRSQSAAAVVSPVGPVHGATPGRGHRKPDAA